MSKLLSRDMDIERRTDITMAVLGFTGFLINCALTFFIAYYFADVRYFIIFFVIFGVLRLRRAEHYDIQIRCIVSTILIFLIYIIITDNFSINIATDIFWAVLITLLFREF